MEATVGSSITVVCTVSWSSYQWQKKIENVWSRALLESSKYLNANTSSLTINNIDINDDGKYRCTAGSHQLYIDVTVTSMYSR